MRSCCFGSQFQRRCPPCRWSHSRTTAGPRRPHTPWAQRPFPTIRSALAHHPHISHEHTTAAHRCSLAESVTRRGRTAMSHTYMNTPSDALGSDCLSAPFLHTSPCSILTQRRTTPPHHPSIILLHCSYCASTNSIYSPRARGGDETQTHETANQPSKTTTTTQARRRPHSATTAQSTTHDTCNSQRDSTLASASASANNNDSSNTT